jgi:GTP 3',8-cyclase
MIRSVNPGPMPVRSPLVDSLGRVMRKLRVSLTDACNFRCSYCMPGDATFSPPQSHLSVAELTRICSGLVDLGLEEIRLTGGEPTLRSDFSEILKTLGRLPFKRKGITSNGQLLERHLQCARDNGWESINISLDSMDAGRFERITGGGHLQKVMASIESAAKMGFELKVNSVVMRGINDDELNDFVEWSDRTGVEVRFLELMKIGIAIPNHHRRFIDADEMIRIVSGKTQLTPIPVSQDSTSFVFTTSGNGKIGFIASESKPFCGDCSRLRLTHTGTLRSCLIAPYGLSLRNAPVAEYAEITAKVVAEKPVGRLEQTFAPMYAIGG